MRRLVKIRLVAQEPQYEVDVVTTLAEKGRASKGLLSPIASYVGVREMEPADRLSMLDRNELPNSPVLKQKLP